LSWVIAYAMFRFALPFSYWLCCCRLIAATLVCCYYYYFRCYYAITLRRHFHWFSRHFLRHWYARHFELLPPLRFRHRCFSIDIAAFITISFHALLLSLRCCWYAAAIRLMPSSSPLLRHFDAIISFHTCLADVFLLLRCRCCYWYYAVSLIAMFATTSFITPLKPLRRYLLTLLLLFTHYAIFIV